MIVEKEEEEKKKQRRGLFNYAPAGSVKAVSGDGDWIVDWVEKPGSVLTVR
jgi:hypothetical protein